ncbi:MAG TPA: alkaline phosphatase family protein [Paludibacter sp.]|nr:MAG: Alkaline phosphatase PafA precursor [Bacteroidetes bacterium ADurb.Bin174]HQB28442.1 alkaline phosphatase family protein [Paludibacter sp.]
MPSPFKKKHKKILSTLWLLFMVQFAFSEQPRLFVGIMVDGLQQRHIEQLNERFSHSGFKKLTSQGAALTRVTCNFVSAGNVSDIATLTSGTIPYYHGVVSNRIYNRLSGKIESVFQDVSQSGIESHLTLSAKHFRSTNVVDELMMAHQRKSKAFAIGLHAEDVIALGGHAANGVVWIDSDSMKWSSTTYYQGGMPWQALDMNENGAFQRFADRVWQPLYNPATYIAAVDGEKMQSFEYHSTTKKHNQTSSTIIKNMPAANSLVAELALRLLHEHDLGMDEFTDALMLQFTVRTPNEKNLALQSLEKEDMYLRLDDELQFLIQKIEYKVGADKVLFVLFGNQTAGYSPEELKAHHVDAGYFNANRSMALLNSYLMAIYGYEKWVAGYYGKNIFLNKKLIEEKEIDLKKMQELAIEFMLEFEGVQSAFGYTQLMQTGGSPDSEMAKLRNSTHKNTAGDIILTLMPGWLEVDDESNPVGESNDLVSYLPIWFYGAKIPAKTITKQYQITDIAPTISEILNIPFTNANLGRPIER